MREICSYSEPMNRDNEKRIAALQAMNKREPRSALDPLRQG